MKKNLICIVCPLGCTLEVELDGTEVISVTGNTCKRGAEYAVSECTAPKRTVTSTVLCENGKVLPVKTSTPIPKEKLFECMEHINSTTASLPVRRGDVIIKNAAGTEADIIATADMD